MASVRPKVVVVDLDYTLWPFWMDEHISPPFRKTSNGVIVDAHGNKVTHYPEVSDVLRDLLKQGYILAIASRARRVEWAHQLFDLFGWANYFSHEEIYPERKLKHLTNIKNALGVDFKDMIFFDDEMRNIEDGSHLGVFSVLVYDGLTKKVVDDAIRQYSKEHSR